MIQDDYWQTCEHSNEPLFHKRQNISSLADWVLASLEGSALWC
jgi:hypothetical protein